MGLKLVERPEFEATVVVNTAHLKGEFAARFVALRTSELEAAQEKRVKAGDGLQGLLLEVCVGFQPVELPGGRTLEYAGEESVRELLDYPGIGPAMSRAYHRALWEETAGNLPQRPAGL